MALSRLPEWLRWLLVVPSAVVAFALIQLVVILAGLLSGRWIPDWAYQLINSFASGWAFVSAAAWMAPRANVVVAILHIVIISVFTGALGGIVLFDPSFVRRSETSSGFFLLAVALTILGGVYACVQTYNERKAPLHR